MFVDVINTFDTDNNYIYKSNLLFNFNSKLIAMLLRCRCVFNLQRVGVRYATSVVPDYTFCSEMPQNEPILGYMKNSKEREQLEAAIKHLRSCTDEIPVVIGDNEYRTGDYFYQVMPHDHHHKLAKVYKATPDLINLAIKVATETQRCWEFVPLNQRFNVYYLSQATLNKPLSPQPAQWRNFMRFRGIDGFMAAITPFNFTAIGGNLAYTPALVGNAVLWKPSGTAVLSNWHVFKICREAGVPAGVVNFIPSEPVDFGRAITTSPYLAGINFTGSPKTFNWLWVEVGKNIESYINYPKMIGECGGKNFHFVHPSETDIESVVNFTIRSAFEYSGQKCSACSRMYVPHSLWPKIECGLKEKVTSLIVDDPTKYDTFTGAVIDNLSFKKIKDYIMYAKNNSGLQVIAGGKCDDSIGYFIEPTIILTRNPHDKLMKEEIFGPVLTVFVYLDRDIQKTMELVGCSTNFALTGAVFAKDEKFLKCALEMFKMAAGNFYINDKSTGSVVGQQPFGGARLSGTNDKPGGPYYPIRLSNPQVIKETYIPQKDILYPYMQQP
ncbi:delta-1-pyrroline-5-carboxylate dehydrogenase, mitochondrial-like isoform X2 [Agrilus planipennis]|uniref:L-glutamate gamma-semialdehyde dehydrogenase n=1 Tax=Agrilus planipennis TaxID=224129 RepID=A0A1W4XS58_AGRPL|nr:delta-1-pyrroline-5-carboxylate dehydrogenase, mitochondrial-like isoform X2 [Agrilus planipennis]